MTYQVAHRSWHETLDLLQNIDAVHGLYYAIMHVVFLGGGDGLTTLRLPSVVGIATATAGVAAIGFRLEGARTGALSASVFAVLPVIQQYGQEGRSYALVTAGVVWASYFFVRALQIGAWTSWIAYAATLVIASWLHEFAALIILPHALVTFVRPAVRPMLRAAVISFAIVGVAVAPLALFSQAQAQQQLSWLGRPSAAVWLQFAAITAVGWACLRYLRYLRSQDAQDPVGLAQLAFTTLAVPPAFLMVVSLIKPWYLERYVVYSMSGFALLMGSSIHHVWMGMGRARPRAIARRYGLASLAIAAGVAVLVPWSLLIRSPESRKDDTVAIAAAVRDVAQQGDGVLFMPSRRREWMLSWPTTYRLVDDIALAHSPQSSGTLQGLERGPASIRRDILSKQRIVALTDPAGQPLDQTPQERIKRQVLRKYYQECSRQVVRGAQVVLYAKEEC
ncbi:glycosyltransferase family 39 protein [Streptomyces sp. 7N604]|uniref:glycosyltransferase family 39 protein n=1 Tax=Streptomyces sp. 7N604 TaxID=3457415 RepID=UPI003FD32967